MFKDIKKRGHLKYIKYQLSNNVGKNKKNKWRSRQDAKNSLKVLIKKSDRKL